MLNWAPNQGDLVKVVTILRDVNNPNKTQELQQVNKKKKTLTHILIHYSSLFFPSLPLFFSPLSYFPNIPSGHSTSRTSSSTAPPRTSKSANSPGFF